MHLSPEERADLADWLWISAIPREEVEAAWEAKVALRAAEIDAVRRCLFLVKLSWLKLKPRFGPRKGNDDQRQARSYPPLPAFSGGWAAFAPSIHG